MELWVYVWIYNTPNVLTNCPNKRDTHITTLKMSSSLHISKQYATLRLTYISDIITLIQHCKVTLMQNLRILLIYK